MGAIVASDLEYSHPGGEPLFFDVSFKVRSGEHVALIGNNGVGKSTLMRILAGELVADAGSVNISGDTAYMSQAVGVDQSQSVREMLLRLAPLRLREVGHRMLDAARAIHDGDTTAGMELGAAIAEWSELGGYQLEARWDAAARRVLRQSLDEVQHRDVAEISGGERKQIVLDYLFSSEASALLLDEPDNFLDIPAKLWLEQLIRESKASVLLISHDRDLLSVAVTKIITLESTGAWVHGGSYADYVAAREQRQTRLGDRLERWQEEERRLYRHYRIMKQRAALNHKNAPKADAAESRWKRFLDAGPPPAPATPQRLHMRLRGGDSARRVISVKGLGFDGLLEPFSTDVYFGERVGLIGPNGSGKTHIMRALAGVPVNHVGEIVLGPRVSPGLFTQFNMRADLAGRPALDSVQDLTRDYERAMRALARYGLRDAGRRPYETLSGGQKARLEILTLELEGHNLLLLDEPTDNLDIDSSEALEQALDQFEGTLVCVSHDRAFVRQLDRYLLVLQTGGVYEILDYFAGVEALTDPSRVGTVRTSRSLVDVAG